MTTTITGVGDEETQLLGAAMVHSGDTPTKMAIKDEWSDFLIHHDEVMIMVSM